VAHRPRSTTQTQAEAREIMARNPGSSVQDSSELGHKNYKENGPEEGTWRVGNQDRELWGYTSCTMAYCEIPQKEGWTISKNTASVDILLLKFTVTWSYCLIHWSAVLWSARKPNWLAFSKFLFIVCFWTVLKIGFSNSLPVVDKRLVGRKLWWLFGSFLGFGSYDFCFLPRCREVTKL
jgi:hypothetical protein